jgi:autotransporter-associated beta strand protein
MKPKSTLLPFLALAASSLMAVSSASAATGTWNVDSNGLWGTDTNWASNIIADGLTSTANFTNNITADRTVSLDTDRTINRVNFADSNTATAGSWILDNNGTSTNNLILSGTTGAATGTVPVIDVGSLGTNKNATISAIIEGSYGFSKAGAGTLVLSGDNTYTGVTTHGSANGITIVAHNNALGSTAAGSHTEITLSGTDNRFIGINNGVNTPENFTIFGSSGTGSTAIRGISGTATLSGTITMDGSGQTRLGGTSATLIWAGTITQVSSKSNGLVFYGNNTISNAMTINGGSLTAVSGTVTLNGVNPTDGTGLGDAGTYGGSFTLGVTNALRTDGNFSFAGGGSNLNLNGNNQTIKGLISAASTGYTVSNNASSTTSTLTVGNGGGDYSFGGVIRNNTTGNGIVALVKTGAGNQTLIGTNIFTGGTRIDDGTLTLGHATDTLSSTGAINVNGGTLALGTNTDTVGAVTLTSGNITGSGTALQGVLTGTSYDVRSGSVSAILGGSGALTKSTAGTVTLSGANTYSGATNVNSGTLLINGNNSAATGAVSVAAGATHATAVRLKGIGTVGGNTTFAADPDATGDQVGGIHSPGASVGKQTFDQAGVATTNLTYNTGSIFEWELAATPAATVISDGSNYTSNRGTAYDAVNVTGTVSGSEAIFRIVLDGAQTFGHEFWSEARTWTDIFRNGDGTGSANVSNWASVFSGGFQYYNYSGDGGALASIDGPSAGSFSLSGNTLSYSFAAIPEPTTALAGLLLTAGLLRRRRN